MSRNDLSHTEQRVAAAMLTGRVVDLGGEAERDIRADVLAELLIHADSRAVAARLRGAHIVGHFNLGGRAIPIPLDFRDCIFTGKILLAKTSVPELSLRGSICPHGISAREMRVDGALNLTDCRLEDRLYLKRLSAAILYLDRAHVHSSGSFAIQLRGAEIARELYARNLVITAGLNIYGAKIGGQMLLDNARLSNTGDVCVHANNLDVGQDLRLRGTTTNGPINLVKAKIRDNLELTGAAFAALGDKSFDASMVEVGENVLLDGGFSAVGEVDFFLARIAGRVEVDGAWLRNPGSVALDLARTDVGQSVLLNQVAVEGAVHVYGARIAGQLSLNDSTIVNHGDVAVHAVQCSIAQSLWIGHGSRFDGELDLTNASVGNRFWLFDSRISSIRATDLAVDILDDDPDCWPDGSHIVGLTYNRLPEDPRGWPSARVPWVRRLQPVYSPQPYTQLASVYQSIGSIAGNRAAVIAREVARRGVQENFWHRLGSRAWGALLRWTIGFGYAPWRSIPWMVALFTVGWVVFATAPEGSFTSVSSKPAEDFHPALHALDSVLPVIRLDIGSQWVAHGVYPWWEAGLSLTGWFMGLVVGAGVAGVFKRD